MARVALIKLFTGLNLAVSQLSAELRRAGHDTRIIYFKDFLVVPVDDVDQYRVTDYALTLIGGRAKEVVWNCYRPITEREYALLGETLRAFGPDLIGFSLTSLTMQVAAEVTAWLRRHFDVPIIWGGAGPTIEPEVAITHADAVCVGEGEHVIVELAGRLDARADYADLQDLWVRRADGSIARNPTRPLLDLETIAIPDFARARTVHIGDDRIEHDFYPVFIGSQYPIMTQRGCPFSCAFCIESVYQDMFGKQNSLRRRSVDVVIEELVAAKRTLGIRQVMFYDDVFTLNPRWLREFAGRYKAEVGLPFWCYTYPTTTRREDIALLKDAGLRSITMGIQTGSDRVLRDDFKRPVAKAKAVEAARIIIECGVDCYFDLISKTHSEREEDCRETFEFLVEFPREMKCIGFGAMVPFPKFGYTERVTERQGDLSLGLSQHDYDYYHRLYYLTRTGLPRGVVRALGRSRLVRRFPRLVDVLLPEELPPFFLLDDAGDGGAGGVDNGQAQAIVAGSRLDRGAAAAS
jgi:radical SAM superfamily enzyme YgiQ (UPF0313 family)